MKLLAVGSRRITTTSATAQFSTKFIKACKKFSSWYNAHNSQIEFNHHSHGAKKAPKLVRENLLGVASFINAICASSHRRLRKKSSTSRTPYDMIAAPIFSKSQVKNSITNPTSFPNVGSEITAVIMTFYNVENFFSIKFPLPKVYLRFIMHTDRDYDHVVPYHHKRKKNPPLGSATNLVGDCVTRNA